MPPIYKHAAPPGLKTCVFLSRKRVGGPNPYEQEGWETRPLRIQFLVFYKHVAPLGLGRKGDAALL